MIEPTQIASVRRRLGLSQSELARKSGVSQSLITKIEAGRLDPSYSRLKAISQVLERATVSSKPSAFEIMNRELLKIDATDSVARAIEIMTKHSVSQLPVFVEHTLGGTVTESGLLEFVVRRGTNAESLQTSVREVMSDPLPQVPPDTNGEDLVPLLNHFPAVLVSTKGQIQGIITKSDLLSNAKTNPTSVSTLHSKVAKPPQLT